jgi:L-2-hydroxyglutarate oxidase LhgO
VIHGGIYYQPGSLKAQLCVEGAARMYEYAQQHQIAHERCGKLIIAVRDSEMSRVDELERRGLANGVLGLRRISAAEIRDIEPNATGTAALHAPNTGIIDYTAVTRAIRQELEEQKRRLLIRHRSTESRAARRVSPAGERHRHKGRAVSFLAAWKHSFTAHRAPAAMTT